MKPLIESTSADDTCVICKQSIKENAIGLWIKGNNAEPIARGQCCDPCNSKVITKRITGLYA